MKELVNLLVSQNRYDEATKIILDVRTKLELAFSFEASDRLRDLKTIETDMWE